MREKRSNMLNMTDDTMDSVRTQPGGEGWTTTEVAAAALRRDPRTVKRLINSNDLVGRQVKRGRARPWEVDVASLKQLRDRWVVEGRLERSEATGDVLAGGYEEAEKEEGVARAFTRIAQDLAEARAQAADASARLELTAQAESTTREELAEELAEERHRREIAEREADDLLREREVHQKDLQRIQAELEAERSKGFLRRLFG